MKLSFRISSTDSTQGLQTPGLRNGFGIVEVIVAMVLLAISVTALGSLSYSVSQSSMRVAGDAYRNGILLGEVNRLEALPYDSLPITTTTVAIATAPYPHTRYVTITTPAVNTKTIKIVVKPVNARYKADSVTFTRTRARTTRVLNTTLP